jgi:hypothetical protein
VSYNLIAKEIKEKGRVVLKDANNISMLWVLPNYWDANTDGGDGVFLLHEIFQIRSIAEQFSEVALDIVEFSQKPVVFHTPVNKILSKGPIQNGLIKFFMIKNPEWKKLLFSIAQPVIIKSVQAEANFSVSELMPIFSPHVKEMFLTADGEVKILGI